MLGHQFIGFVSNPRATVSLYALDVDPCTGENSERIVASMGLRGGRNAQNKFEYRNDLFTGYAREYKVITEIDGIQKTRLTKNGIVAGEYVQPINVWVHGEQDVPGVPPVPFDFSQMAWLTKGVGRDADGNIWGPISPFPQTGVLIDAPACPNAAARKNSTITNNTLSPSAATPAPVSTADEGSTATVPLEKRVTFGRWHSRSRNEAEADAENKGTTNPKLMRIAPQPERVDNS